jgi:cobalt transporter subunit CbtA
MIRHFLASALFAGLLSGLVVTGLQQATTVPLIHQAEQYEDALAAAATPHTHDHAAPGHAGEATAAAHEDAHAHGADGGGWTPADGIERLAYTTLANVIAGVGFGFLLVACFALWNGKASGRSGVLWGLAGFAVFTLAPSLGLAPELPATNAGELMARQTWWILTAAATATGLWLLVFPQKLLASAAGIVAIALPHIIGAPHPHELSTVIPAELAAHFTAASIVTSAVFWACLGWLAGTFYGRSAAATETSENLPYAA